MVGTIFGNVETEAPQARNQGGVRRPYPYTGMVGVRGAYPPYTDRGVRPSYPYRSASKIVLKTRTFKNTEHEIC